MEMNAFVHFTINTFTDKEWGYGDEDPKLFDPKTLNAEQWVSVLKDAGFKGVILTTKHHDGFCLWPSKYTDHSIASSPYKNGKGDLVREVADACKKYNMKFGIYMSPWDRNRADYGSPSYVEYYRNQLKELFTNYGPVFEMWFDGANGGDGYYGGAREKRPINGKTYYDWPKTLQLVRKMEPNVIFFSDAGPGVRWVGNENGEASATNWNTISPDTLYAGKPGIEHLLGTGSKDGNSWIPAEVDVSIRPGWFYHQKEDSLVKTPEKLFDIYLKSVGRGSTLLLNVCPDKNGLIPAQDVEVLKQFKALRESAFRNNMIQNASISASSQMGASNKFSVKNCLDGDPETFWTTKVAISDAELIIELNDAISPKYLIMQEYIKNGQRIKSFTIEGWNGSSWQLLGEGTTVGHKRILPLNSVSCSKFRISVKGLRSCPQLSTIELY